MEASLGVALPEVLKLASIQFSGIYHEAPYFMGDACKAIQSQIIKSSKHELTEYDFSDDLEIQTVYSPAEWESEDLVKMKALNVEYLRDVGKNKHIGVDCNLGWLVSPKFMMIGTTYSESLYIDLRELPNNAGYGAIYNFVSLDPFGIMYKLADDYGQFLLNIKHSLEKKIQIDAEDGDDT